MISLRTNSINMTILLVNLKFEIPQIYNWTNQSQYESWKLTRGGIVIKSVHFRDARGNELESESGSRSKE
jgi:hypothetical protein